MGTTRPKTNVETGEFPYALTDRPEESRYLTWVRNHSNYMAERGFLDYLRMAGVLMRGILVNFLTLVPYLLLASLVLGLVYKDRISAESLTPVEAFRITPVLVVIAVAWVLAFPILARLSKIASHKKTLKTGSSSSIKLRDRFERTFGGFLLAILAALLVESFTLLAHYFTHYDHAKERPWTYPTAIGLVGALVAANKVLPLLGGKGKKLVIALVGALGLVVPLVVVLIIVKFIVHSDPYESGLLTRGLILLPVVLVVGILAAMILGSFQLKGIGKLSLLLVQTTFLILAAAVLVFFAEELKPHTNAAIVLVWMVEVWTFSSLAVDVNLTSINGLYRDRLASAFLVGVDTKGDVDIEQDIDLQEICNYDAGSSAPYHLVNVTLNLQGSKDISIRERNSDFFIFSKRFIGSDRTGYCRSEHMEQVYPQIDLGTAMAISAAAASPNMGRGTNPLMVAFLTLLNVRLGFWIPNPGHLERDFAADPKPENTEADDRTLFPDVFRKERAEIERRREQAYQSKTVRSLDGKDAPTTAHNLVGIGFSGGGIRSATINLGIAQELHRRGVFDHIDYMSTVSGGGYLGSSISTLMRYRSNPVSETPGKVEVEKTESGETIVRVTGKTPVREYHYSGDAELTQEVKDKPEVEQGQRLLQRSHGQTTHNTLMDRYRWRVRPSALMREMVSKLDETHDWVNLSDGGHIENLAAIELLRRRCRFIIVGDGEADPNLHFNGLATLIRYAKIDLGITIDIRTDLIRVDKSKNAVDEGRDNLSREHWAIGEIEYPRASKDVPAETGYLLYLKSSFSGDENEMIQEYRHRNPDFPHQSTADQFFDEDQFECYRALGEHIAVKALEHAPEGELTFDALEDWFTSLETAQGKKLQESSSRISP